MPLSLLSNIHMVVSANQSSSVLTFLSQICSGLLPMLYRIDKNPLWNVFLNIFLLTSQYIEYKLADVGKNYQHTPKPNTPSSQVNRFCSVYKMARPVVKDRIACALRHVAKVSYYINVLINYIIYLGNVIKLYVIYHSKYVEFYCCTEVKCKSVYIGTIFA